MAVILAVVTAILTRVLFAAHSAVVVWRVTVVRPDINFWIVGSAGMGLMLIEAIVTLVKKKGGEWKWFCPSFFLFLCCVVPGIWILETDRIEHLRDELNNSTQLSHPDDTHEEEKGKGPLDSISKVDVPIHLDPDTWVLTIEQTMLFLLIVGRWLMPSGDITRDQLSQLLFVYIGMASDIMELFYLFDEDAVVKNEHLGLAILGLYSVSLLQFTLVLTATRARRPMVALIKPSKNRKVRQNSSCLCCETEIWSLLITVFLQDAPFLTMRLYVLVRYDVLNYNILFFTAKNALVILLQFYRIAVVILEQKKSQREVFQSPKVHPLRAISNGHLPSEQGPPKRPLVSPQRHINRHTSLDAHGRRQPQSVGNTEETPIDYLGSEGERYGSSVRKDADSHGGFPQVEYTSHTDKNASRFLRQEAY